MDTYRAVAFIDKGGTGKTTTVAHLGVGLAHRGYEVLLIDLAGKQGDLAKHFGVWDTYRDRIEHDEAWPNISTVFDDAWDTIAGKLGDEAVLDLILDTEEGVDLIPAHPGLDTLDAELGNIDDVHERYTRLATFLNEYIDPLSYEVVLIDLPGMTNNISYNGLWAARNVITPVEMGPFETEQADSLRHDLAKITDTFPIQVQLTLVLPNKVDTRTRLAQEYLEAFESEYPTAVAPAHVPRSQDIRNATEQGMTVFSLAQPSPTAKQAQDAYLRSADRLLTRLTETSDTHEGEQYV